MNKKILLLCNYYPETAGTILDHIFAFKKYSIYDYNVLSIFGDIPDWVVLSRFDALVIHYSLIASNDNYISKKSRELIRRFNGLKAAFVQDDYRWINDTVDALAYMRIDTLFTLADQDIVDKVYSPIKLADVRKVTVLAGYVPEKLVNMDVPDYESRKIDVGYRARKLPAWMGSHTLQKWQIAEKFIADNDKINLNIDISCSEDDRIYGDKWIQFVSNCKAILGTESGASVCDYTGDIQRNVENYELSHPDATFEELRDMFFKDEDCKIMMNVISPRCFESAALRTLMIMYEGAYSGVLVPWRHYVPLERDHSNIELVRDIVKSPDQAKKIINGAYTEIAKNEKYTFRGMVKLVDIVMQEENLDIRPSAFNILEKEEYMWLQETCSPRDPRKSCLSLHLDDLRQSRIDDINHQFECTVSQLIKIEKLYIKWDEKSSSSPKQFCIAGYNDDVEVFNKVIENRSMQSVFMQDKMELPYINKLLIITDLKSNPFQIVVVKEDVVAVSKEIYTYSYSIAYRVWVLLPESIRKCIRPIIRIARG